MKNVEERAKFDDYEMLDEYDFSDGVRGRFYKPANVPTTMRLDNDVLTPGHPYKKMLNLKESKEKDGTYRGIKKGI